MVIKLVTFFVREELGKGIPYPPLFFCLAEDVLSCAITYLVQAGLLKPDSGPKNFIAPSHVLYADDVLVFGKGTKRNLEVLM